MCAEMDIAYCKARDVVGKGDNDTKNGPLRTQLVVLLPHHLTYVILLLVTSFYRSLAVAH